MQQKFNKIEKISGTLDLPGDKSISHRAVMFAGLAKGTSTIKNILNSEDIKTTRSCFRQLGCSIEENNGIVTVVGRGYRGLSKPTQPLDLGNSGTTARLICGILAAQNFETNLFGDKSLSKRPMKRVIEPLTQMGGLFEYSEGMTLPMTVNPSSGLVPINYVLPIASAQIKSSVILAALHLEGISIITEPIPTRNHSETLLNLKVEKENNCNKIFVSNADYPEPKEYLVPSDISTAAFFIILALLAKNSELVIRNVGLNNTRTGILEILKQMNASITVENEKIIAGENIGDLIIRSSEMKNIEIPQELIPNIIDEIPILSVAGLLSEGSFRISGAKELRFKESDRIKALCDNYRLLGIDVNEFEDGFELSGEIKNKNLTFESYDDHRIAMAFAVLSLLIDNGGTVKDFDCCAISNPDFLNQLTAIVK